MKEVKPGYLLKQKIPIKLTEWDTSKVGYIEVDLVVHCGLSTLGEYMNTVSSTEISFGWWECEAIIGKSQEHSFLGFRGDKAEGSLRMERVGLGQVKLQSKERMGGKVKRRYETANTALQRLIESSQIPEEVRDELNGICLGLSPAELKRNMDAKLAEQY